MPFMTRLVADRSVVAWGSARPATSRPIEGRRWSTAARYLAYTTVIVAILAALPQLARTQIVPVFRENGPLEWLQLGLLAAASGLLAVAAACRPTCRALLAILAAGVLVAVIRELDGVWSSLALPRKAPAIVGAAVFLAVVVRMRRALLAQLSRFVGSRGFALLWMGAVIVGAFAQIVGSEAFLEALVGSDFERDYRRVVEETGELFGCGVLLIGSVETALEAEAPLATTTVRPNARAGADDQATGSADVAPMRCASDAELRVSVRRGVATSFPTSIAPIRRDAPS